MLYDNEIDVLDERLKLYCTYTISNASVKPAREFINLPDPNYGNLWNITRRTMIEDVVAGDEININESVQPHITPFSDFYACLSSRQLINVLAIVICKLPRQCITTRNGQQNINEFVIINEESKPVIITLWGNFVMTEGIQIDLQLSQGKFPIVIAQGVNVNAFQGITLSTRYDTTIEVNPPGQHATVLNKWKDNNLSVIYKTIVDKTYLDSFLTLSNALQQPKCTFAEIDNELKQKPVAWVRGKLRMKNVGPLEYYIGCNYCNKTVNSIEGLKLHCLYCGQTDGLTVRRYKLNVEISDGSTIVQATLFNHDVHRLMLLATLFNHDVHRLMLLVGIEMPTTVEESEIFQQKLPTTVEESEIFQQKLDAIDFVVGIFQQKLDAIDFVVGIRINALNEDHPSTLTYSVACICKDITTDTGEQQATPHARSSNIVEETFMVGNPTKKRLDFDESSKHAIDILEDATSKEKSVSLDKGKRAKVD
ncbi:replication protein A 70 kDa DNA-binding subunit A-like [Ipomoea triloba]|uniref:replication protein A 70 kDa DNA-binding subunit A-like n=1 Tax=Ipomoea triloba TaxID=35885 RepID=UPI00125E85FE|nr:replication protein A 70 kDa DNA-binding subunit A-like [Ipomoea triloba]